MSRLTRTDRKDPDWSWHINWHEICIEWEESTPGYEWSFECKLCGFSYRPEEIAPSYKPIFRHYMDNHEEVIAMLLLQDNHTHAEPRQRNA